MNAELQTLVTALDDRELLRLALEVREALADEAGLVLFPHLEPGAARTLAGRLGDIEARMEAAPDDSALVELARSFLEALLEAEVFDELLAERLLETGVRLRGRAVPAGFQERFGMAELLDRCRRAAAVETAASPPSDDRELPREHEVWFGTNRAPRDPADPTRGFANQRDPRGEVHYGTCTVYIPRAHQFGSTGTPFWQRWKRLEFTDDHLELRAIRPFDSEEAFLASLRERMGDRPADERTVLVYLHGYNTSFEEAALRAAQIGFDLEVETTAFYSWPSREEVVHYSADISRIEASERQIAEFLTAVATRSGADRVHLLAHSMGNRGLARAISRITLYATRTSEVRFGQIILAAPDLDVDLFRELAAVYPRISDRTTMYVSARDKALEMSSYLQDSDRAGFTPPVTVLEGIDTVEVTDIDVTRLGHGYFAEARPVLEDILQLLVGGEPPEEREGTRAAALGAARFWALERET